MTNFDPISFRGHIRVSNSPYLSPLLEAMVLQIRATTRTNSILVLTILSRSTSVLTGKMPIRG